jgi:ATP-dependent DNA helicase RecG
MLAPEELEQLMTDLESDRVERTESRDADKVRKTVCALANDLPGHCLSGYLFVGVDKRGTPMGLSITEDLLSALADARSDGQTLPPPRINVMKMIFGDCPVAVVEVLPSDSPPVRYRGQAWVRVGPTQRIATAEEERRLAERSIAAARTFDQQSCPGATLDELIRETFTNDYLPRAVAPETIQANQRNVEEQLASLRFYDARRGRPTHAGILLFGRDPRGFLPGAYVQFVRYDGVGLADPVQNAKAISGNLVTQLQVLDSLLPAQIHEAREPSSGLRHETVPDYPLAAIREFVMNALMHRTYEGTNAPVRLNWFADRVEIQNPGGLYGQVTPQNFEHASDYRNPVLAEAMKVLGFVERFGVGIARAKDALRRNGNAPPEFVFEPTHVLVTVRRRP